jgi:hypothetical protein
MFTDKGFMFLWDYEKKGNDFFPERKGRINALRRKGSNLKFIMVEEGVAFTRRLENFLPKCLTPSLDAFRWWGYIPALSFQPLMEAIRPWNKLIKHGVPDGKRRKTWDVVMPTRHEGDHEVATLGEMEASRELGEFEVCPGANALKISGGGLVVKAVVEQSKVRLHV